MVITRLARVPAAVGMALTLVGTQGCTGSEPLLGYSPEPAVYLVLSRQTGSPSSGTLTDSTLYALVVTAGSPIASEYRDVESFQLRRVADDAMFGWESISRGGTLPNVSRGVLLPEVGNFALAWDASSSGLGRSDLQGGTSYTLNILSGDRTITGQTVLPETPMPEIRSEGSGDELHWSRSVGAAAYFVIVDTDDPGAIVTSDTSYTILYNRPLEMRPTPTKARVIAMDANVYRYVSDTTSRRSGVEGALGVFGGIASAEIALPDGRQNLSTQRTDRSFDEPPKHNRLGRF